MDDSERAAHLKLAQFTVDLDEVAGALQVAAAKPAANAPFQLKHIMKLVSEAVEFCAEIIEDHSNGTVPASTEFMHVVAATMRSVHDVASAIVLVEAVRSVPR